MSFHCEDTFAILYKKPKGLAPALLQGPSREWWEKPSVLPGWRCD